MFPDPAIAQAVDATDSANGLGNTGKSTQALFVQGLGRYRFKRYSAVRMPVRLIAGERDFEPPIDLRQAPASKLPRAP